MAEQTSPDAPLPHVDLGERPFARWAGPDHAVTLSPRVLSWLDERLGGLTPAEPDVTAPSVRPSALSDAARRRLRDVVGAEYVDESDDGRLAHTGGQSYVDVLGRRAGLDPTPPDAVVRPSDHAQVLRVLTACSEHGVAVVPYGGGTSVVGGVDAERGPHASVITLDLTRLDRMLDIDATSQLATFEAGVTGPSAERMLLGHGHTLGHYPQSYARATLGGYVATRSAGQASTGFGRIDDLVVRLRAATPVGEIELGTGTPNAAGPDLRALFVGSEGALGVLTEVTLRVRPRPTATHYEMWAFPSFSAGLEVVRGLVGADAAPDVLRLSDETETLTGQLLAGLKGRAAALLTRLRHIRTPAFCVLGWEGEHDVVRRRRRSTLAYVRDTGAVALGARAGESWRHQRFAGPLQRDTLMDAGVLVETVETATTWSNLPRLYDAVRTALTDTLKQDGIEPLVLTHVSHLYPSGASLYFTVMARALPEPRDAIAQWQEAKAAASEAIVRHKGTITHHHAVGRHHAGDLEAEIGPVGLHVLRRTKAALDPAGILNPGVLTNPSNPA